MRHILTSVLLAAFIAVSTSNSFANQPDPPEDILRPAELRASWGAFLGGTFSFSSGNLVTTCNCTYENGSGFNGAAGVFIQLPLYEQFSVVIEALYDGSSASYKDEETRPEYVQNGDIEDITFEKNADITLSYAAVDILGKWNIAAGSLYIMAGPSIGYFVGGTIEEKEKMKTPGFIYATTGTSEMQVLDSGIGDVYDMTSVRFGLRGGIGYEIPLTRTMTIQPELMYHLSLTGLADGFAKPVSSTNNGLSDWKHSELQLLVRLNMLF